MLVRFSVENFHCFRERVELSMVAAPLNHHPNHVVHGRTPQDIPLLKLAVVYGANASGKSNLVLAMETGMEMILRPAEAGKLLSLMPYKLDTETLRKPSRFEFEIKLQDRYFAYGFAVSAREVEEEWLYELNGGQESCIFERVKGEFRSPGLRCDNAEEEQFLQFTAKGTLPNRFFLTECRERNLQRNVPAAAVLFEVLHWFENDLQVVFPDSKFEPLFQLVKSNQDFKEELARYLYCFDTGVEGIDLEDVAVERVVPERFRQELGNDLKQGESALVEKPGARLLVTRAEDGDVHAWRLVYRHARCGIKGPALFDPNEMSDGTLRLTDLAPALIRLLKGKNVFVVDEFDRSLHPDIAHSLIANFLRYSGGGSSQLIVTTHETTLLLQDFLRPDEVWFMEKKPGQGSQLISLAEYKLKDTSDLQRDYLQGRFGGVPVIHDFSWLGEPNAKGT